jgi:succinate dehydrogenase / fumarate reductase flavoprotein subunit
MFDDIPDNYKPQTASDPEEGWRYTQGDKSARRPPELLTRDHVARCINREVKAGRGSEHGGVYLDIAWIKEKIGDSEAHIRRKLPSMYHQFKELADLDITQEAMEVGPTTHYIMGGVRVEPDTGAATVPGLFAAGEAAAGMHGANRLGGNSLSDLLVFGRRAGAGAAAYAKGMGPGGIDPAEIETETRDLLAPLERGEGENPFELHRALQDCMQAKVGIYRTEADLEQALTKIQAIRERSRGVKVAGGPAFNPGWHLVRDLRSLLLVSEAVARSALLRRESRGAHSRLDFPATDPALGKVNMCAVKIGEAMRVSPTTLPAMPAELEKLFEPAKEKVG